MDYIDSPQLAEKYLETLSDTEASAFHYGFATALQALMEEMLESKMNIASMAMDPDDNTHKMQLLSRLYILDIYERKLKERLVNLSKEK